jgi:hypothetical protein
LQATTLANAADDTEAEQAEHTLIEMGPKALQTVREISDKATTVGKARLAKVMDAVTPHPLEAGSSSRSADDAKSATTTKDSRSTP